MYHKVVIHYVDGNVVRGYAEDFDPHEARITLNPDGEPGTHVMVHLKEVKAIFFVRDFYGDYSRRKIRGFERHIRQKGERIAVDFKDGERMWGYVYGDVRRSPKGFILYPADQKDNNERVFILRDAVETIHHN